MAACKQTKMAGAVVVDQSSKRVIRKNTLFSSKFGMKVWVRGNYGSAVSIAKHGKPLMTIAITHSVLYMTIAT